VTLSKEEKEKYERALKEARGQIKGIEEEMEKELEKTRQRLQELLEEKKAVRKIYDGIASLLGKDNEFEEEDKKDEGDETKLDINKSGNG